MDRDRGYHLPPIYGTILQPHQTRLRMLKNIFVRKLISCFPYIMQEFVT